MIKEKSINADIVYTILSGLIDRENKNAAAYIALNPADKENRQRDRFIYNSALLQAMADLKEFIH